MPDPVASSAESGAVFSELRRRVNGLDVQQAIKMPAALTSARK